MIFVFLILMSPIVTFLAVALKGDRDSVQQWKDMKNMKDNIDFKNNEDKREKAKKFFGL